MKNKITKRGLFAVSAKTIDERKPEVVALMKRYGMNVNVNDSKDKIDMAFLSLLPRSRSFRQDFAQLATPVAEKIHSKYKNYVGEDFFNIFGLEKIFGKEKDNSAYDIMAIPSKGISTSSNMPQPIGGGVAGAIDAKAKAKSGFGSWISDVFDKDTTQNIINTGLGIYAYQKTGGTQGAPNPLQQGRADVQTGTGSGSSNESSTVGGLGTGGIIAISLGAIALVGFGIYYATKK